MICPFLIFLISSIKIDPRCEIVGTLVQRILDLTTSKQDTLALLSRTESQSTTLWGTGDGLGLSAANRRHQPMRCQESRSPLSWEEPQRKVGSYNKATSSQSKPWLIRARLPVSYL